MSNLIKLYRMELLNLKEQEVAALIRKHRNYVQVGDLYLKSLRCREIYISGDQIIFQKNRHYLLWVCQCRYKNINDAFCDFVAFPGIEKEDAPWYHIVPLTTFSQDYKEQVDNGNHEINGDKYRLIKDFCGNLMLIPHWHLEWIKIRKFAENELGKGNYGLYPGIFGGSIADPEDLFIGWEIVNLETHHYKIFNIFNGKFEKNHDYGVKIRIGHNQKSIIIGDNNISYHGQKLIIKIT